MWGGKRVGKDDARVAAYGDVDEVNCAIGAAAACLAPEAEALRPLLTRIQQELFEVGALLAAYDAAAPAAARLEREIDEMTADLPKMDKFILPGGSPAGAALHLARAVCRRAERSAVRLSRAEKLAPAVVIYLNRLSDHLFTAARWANHKAGRPETFWAGRAKKK